MHFVISDVTPFLSLKNLQILASLLLFRSFVGTLIDFVCDAV